MNSKIISRLTQPIIIVGMHRSGTTFLSGLLHSSGIFMGNDQSPTNESGFFQRRNIKLLKSIGHAWDKPAVPDNVDEISWSDFDFLKNYFRLFKNPFCFINLSRGGPWGWKDPRNTFTLKFWLTLFPNAKIVHIYRNGMDVALSLYKRNSNLPKSARFYSTRLENKLSCLDLWEEYIVQAENLKASIGERMLSVQFEKLLVNDLKEINRLEVFLEKPFKDLIEKTVDGNRTARFVSEEHKDLREYAAKSPMMKKLGYV